MPKDTTADDRKPIELLGRDAAKRVYDFADAMIRQSADIARTQSLGESLIDRFNGEFTSISQDWVLEKLFNEPSATASLSRLDLANEIAAEIIATGKQDRAVVEA